MSLNDIRDIDLPNLSDDLYRRTMAMYGNLQMKNNSYIASGVQTSQPPKTANTEDVLANKMDLLMKHILRLNNAVERIEQKLSERDVKHKTDKGGSRSGDDQGAKTTGDDS
jgi:hypothetical protein